ncbi:Cytochrome P450 4V2 [Araneus ventricosus]|uniref:Cytochrome P450 4V2 n=1 Tax=Araneus ventricosus TaxID=182803 RepID=A0A4Y2TRQ2_ARAVE|nr:Cytochrome P450 4V2 [Araneus ventricosus]
MLEKSLLYKVLNQFSGVAKWKQRKKLLAPCFHLDVLRGFLSVFNEQSRKLVEFFQEETTKDFTYIETPVTLTTLDIICETMFGVKVGALENSSSENVQSFRRTAVLVPEYLELISYEFDALNPNMVSGFA